MFFDYLQLTLKTLIAKERSLKINNDECLTRWNNQFFSRNHCLQVCKVSFRSIKKFTLY